MQPQVLPGHSGGALVWDGGRAGQQLVVGMLVQHTVVSDGEGGCSFLPHFNCRCQYKLSRAPCTELQRQPHASRLTPHTLSSSVPAPLLQLVLRHLESGAPAAAAMRVFHSSFAVHRSHATLNPLL